MPFTLLDALGPLMVSWLQGWRFRTVFKIFVWVPLCGSQWAGVEQIAWSFGKTTLRGPSGLQICQCVTEAAHHGGHKEFVQRCG